MCIVVTVNNFRKFMTGWFPLNSCNFIMETALLIYIWPLIATLSRVYNPCGGHPLVKQVVTLSFNAKVDLTDF